MYTELWAIQYNEIEAFILSENGTKLSEGNYRYKNASIVLTKKADKKLGPLSFPQNLMVISGDIKDAEEFHSLFKLRYLKAGG